MLTLYHNNRCSKSREALDLIIEMGLPYKIRYYLESPLDRSEIRSLLEKLDIPAIQLIRQQEPLFKELTEGKKRNKAGLIRLMVEHPLLIERPVVEYGSKAIIARPAQRFNELFS